jgi:signal transduction histidine kinase/CheY-like chemotaxis protein
MGNDSLNDREGASHLELLRQQTVLARFGELALKSDSLDEILAEACHLVGDGLGTDLATVLELQEDRTTLLVRAGIGWKPGVMPIATDDTPEGHAPAAFPDTADGQLRYPPSLANGAARAVANVPIIGSQGRSLFGVLQIESRKPRHFTGSDISFLRSYANLVAAAVDRLRVIGEVWKSNEALEARVVERTRELVEAHNKLRIAYEGRERVEDALRQSTKMEAVGQLTGGLAHDFNNLLTGISGSLELIRTRTAQGRTAELGRYIEAALASAARAASLTHHLLAFARRQTLDPKVIDLNQLVGSMKDLFSRAAGPSIQIETKLPFGLWPILCDRNQLESALLDLVANARDAMPLGGRLTIETANLAVPSDDAVTLAFTDTGTGMTPEVLARAFDPFFTTKPLGQGTGLGLSMIHGFVQQSGGHVRLRSSEGQGTQVTITLPRHAEAAAEAVVAAEATDAHAIVLVVEDEPPVRMIVVDVLSDLGYTVLEAGDGRSGLSILESASRIDLLVTDVGLPGGMNGRQLADASRRRRPGLKVLFITGYADSAVIGLLSRDMQVLTKPFGLDALAARVQGIING